MRILAIESSCDETSLAVLSGTPREGAEFVEYINSFTVESSVVSSQIKIHEKYGGVVPEIGARLHANQIHFLFRLLVDNIGSKMPIISLLVDEHSTGKLGTTEQIEQLLQKLDGIYVTTHPGLTSALRVGKEFGKTLLFWAQKAGNSELQLHEMNHLDGHVFSCFFQKDQVNQLLATHEVLSTPNHTIFPHLHLIVSGGNSQILLLTSPQDRKIIGQTLDDAAGECLDKIGRMLGIPYPGGVGIARIAGLADENPLHLSVGMKHNTSLDVSYSGLKTAVRLMIEAQPLLSIEQLLASEEMNELLTKDISELSGKLLYIKQMAISAQYVVVKQLMNKVTRAIALHNPNSIGLSGGVSANRLLRKHIANTGLLHTFIPPLHLTGDNAIMIALAGLASRYVPMK
jgi:N6-L-threonylcarbamoyladenine synthase